MNGGEEDTSMKNELATQDMTIINLVDMVRELYILFQKKYVNAAHQRIWKAL